MSRQPSIHITEKELTNILRDMFEEDFSNWDFKKIATDITKRAKGKQLSNRKLVVSNDKLVKQATKMVKASMTDVEQLNQLIFYIRKTKTKLYIREKFKAGSKDYTQLKELASVCNQFCNTFGFSKKEGYTKYLTECIPHISSSLNYVGKIINMAEKVFNTYETKNLIDNDDNPKLTKEILDYYSSSIIKKTGMDTITMNPSTYIKFIDVRKKIEELKVDPEVYIDAQFEGLAWTDNYPEPSQLLNDKALERLNKYIYKHNIKNKVESKSKDSELKDKLLKMKRNGRDSH